MDLELICANIITWGEQDAMFRLSSIGEKG